MATLCERQRQSRWRLSFGCWCGFECVVDSIFAFKVFKMSKSIKSGVREMVFCMIGKFKEKQQQSDAVFKQKQDCLRVVLNFLVSMTIFFGTLCSIRCCKFAAANAANFNKWFKEKLIPHLEEPSLIVMDNASYHSVIINKAPNTQTRKNDIREWLSVNKISYEDHHTKAELLCMVNRNKPDPIYEADEILKQHGHEVLRLPPYHCDLNAIELVWSLAKRKVASRNIAVTTTVLEEIIKESFENITSQEWKKMTDHVIHVENKYKERDRITEENLESFIIKYV